MRRRRTSPWRSQAGDAVAAAYLSARAQVLGPPGPPPRTAWERLLERVELLPSQRRFVESQAREVLDCGGFRSGKTFGLCAKLVRRASVPGAVEGLFRLELAELRRTTLPTLLRGAGATPPALIHGTYVHRRSDQEIDLGPSGGGAILYGGCEDLQRIRGMSLTGAAVDQAEELSHEHWAEVGARVSVPLRGTVPQLYGTANADRPDNYLVALFSIDDPRLREPGRDYLESSVRENPHVDPGFVAYMEGLPPVARALYLENRWVAAEGLVFDMWDRAAHVRRRAGPWVCGAIGVDPGYSHRTGASLVLMDADGWVHVVAQVWRPGLVNPEKIEVVLGLGELAGAAWSRGRPGANTRFLAGNEGKSTLRDPPSVHVRVVVDSEDAVLSEELRRAGIPAEPAVKGPGSRLAGVSRMQALLAASAAIRGDPDDHAARVAVGRQGMTVDPGCEGWLKEAPAYQWDDSAARDSPAKGYDDAIDSVRYALTVLRSPSSGPRLRVVSRA